MFDLTLEDSKRQLNQKLQFLTCEFFHWIKGLITLFSTIFHFSRILLLNDKICIFCHKTFKFSCIFLPNYFFFSNFVTWLSKFSAFCHLILKTKMLNYNIGDKMCKNLKMVWQTAQFFERWGVKCAKKSWVMKYVKFQKFGDTTCKLHGLVAKFMKH